MISMMSPKGKNENDEGLLEYLEDIIGSSKFVEATNEAFGKVEALTEVRQEKLNRVKAVEKEKDNLEGAKQEAEALLAKEREIRKKQNILYHIHAMRADNESSKLSEKKEEVVLKLTQERERITQANERIEEIENGLAEQRKDYEAAFHELKKTKDEFSAYERKDIKLREEIKHERAQAKKLVTKVKAEDKKEKTATEKGENAAERIPQLEEEIQQFSELKLKEDAKLEAIEEETKTVTQQIRRELETKTQELAPVKQERSVLQAALDTAEAEMKISEDSTVRAKDRLASAEDELASLDGTQSGKRMQLQETQQTLESARKEISGLETEDQELAKREESLGRRHRDLLAQLEDARSALRTTGGGSRSKAVRGILKAAQKGGELSKVGVLGRLGDLATVPEKYDVAVSTACGMLDHVVVQTTAGAQRCLEFLRKYNLGRASFVPLDKQKKGAHDRAVETPEGAPRLFELIAPSNFAVTPALYLAVGNTLVAPDLETATRWAYDFSKRWRVVTLDGKLIETAGTMSGGGKSVRRGGMRLSNKRSVASAVQHDDSGEELVDRLEKESELTLQHVQECRNRRRAIKDALRILSKTVKSLEIKMPKLNLEISGCDTTRQELTKLIPELRLQCQVSDEDKTKRAELQAKVEQCILDMKSCAILADRLEKEVARLQQDIMEAGGPRLKKQQVACAKVMSKLKDSEKALNSSKVEIVASEKAKVKAQKAKEKLEKELEDCKNSLQQKETEFKTLEEGAFAVMQAYESVKVIEAEKRTALDSASKEAEELKESQAKIKCVEIDLLGQIDAFDKQISENRKKKNHWEKEIKRLQKVEDECDYELVEDRSTEEPDHMDIVQEDDEGREVNRDDDSVSQNENDMPLSYAMLEKYDTEDLKEAIAILENERNMLAKNANMGAIAEYRKKESDYLARVGELDQVSNERNDARREHEELRRQRLEMFMEGFGAITLKLKEMYQMITLGGDAELELVDSLDPFSEGIVFSVRPPKKSWKNISNLSGGEKTLSSLSLVFALHHYKPTPLYVMDEIDAALDFKNVSIVANYIKERTKNAQFIIISLRNNMFELADRLVGIYKTNNCTKSVTINPRAFGVSGQQDGRRASAAALVTGHENKENESAMAMGKDASRDGMFMGSNQPVLPH
mmetsp:Transcript_10732/g.16868  ORF Transcript_10732/g.16868 Transcript_10732/m.16868 type:complete len:1150 (-) Transcript_10732:83-3532(-)